MMRKMRTQLSKSPGRQHSDVRAKHAGSDQPPRILDPDSYKARIKAMWGRRGAQYDSADTFHKSLAEKLVSFASPSPGQKVLDIATGTGMVAIPAAQLLETAGKVIGIDISESMLHEARKKAAVIGIEEDQLQFVLADAESVPFPEESFHLITCSSGMLYLQDHEQALKRMLDWLKPGGKLCFNTPQEPCVPATAVFNKLLHKRTGIHLADAAAPMADAPVIKELLSRCGFDETEVRTSHEIILFEGATPELYADKIWKSLTAGAFMCPLDGLITEEELESIKPLYREEVVQLATPWVGKRGVANPYTMLWVAASKSA